MSEMTRSCAATACSSAGVDVMSRLSAEPRGRAAQRASAAARVRQAVGGG